jgi:hypothetical protein
LEKSYILAKRVGKKLQRVGKKLHLSSKTPVFIGVSKGHKIGKKYT